MSLKQIIHGIRIELKAKDRVREEVLAVSREIVRLSSEAILSTHRDDYVGAKRKLAQIKKKIARMEKVLQGWPEIVDSGAVSMAYQEFAEAALLLGFVAEDKFPSPEKLGIPSIPYILGLADVVGELRRRALDSIRAGDLGVAEKSLVAMEDVQNLLMTLEHAHVLAQGLRRKIDVARKLIEETRGDVTTEARRSLLEKSIKKLEKRVGRE